MSEKPKISRKSYIVSALLIACTVIQLAHVKAAYNVPYEAVLKTFNKTLCFDITEKCQSNNKHAGTGIISAVLWSIMVVSEPLGFIPAIITGRPTAEAYGKLTMV